MSEATISHANQLGEHAYHNLRDLLVRVEIAPGATLSEDELSAKLGFGLTPIRTAIRRLAFERLVSIFPRRGTFAAEINIGDELWLTEIRQELEGLAAQLASERATDDERASLVELANMIQAASTNAEVTDLDAQFHRRIFRMARNPFLEPTAHLYFNLSLRIWYYCNQNFTISESRGRDQIAVAHAIWQRDGSAARLATRTHLSNASAAIRAMLHARIGP
ncbi:MAG: GntR family transcriptional regulator [Nitratireductor sp.]|nr:GntR family transcriptional regulator [Nitratireductor sp.]